MAIASQQSTVTYSN